MSTRSIRGPLRFNTFKAIITGNFTVVNESLVIVNKTVGAATTITLPASESTTTGPGRRVVIVLDAKGDAATNNITVAAAGTDTVNGGASLVIKANYAWVQFTDLGGGAWVVNPEIAGGAGQLTTITGTSASANALAVGRQGATSPALNVDASAANQVTGFNVAGAAAGAGLALSVIGGNANEALTVDAKGTGAITIGGTSSGILSLGRGSASMPVFSSTKTTISAQNATPTAAQLLGGYIDHNTQTGAGTVTLDTAAHIDAAIAGVATGDSFQVAYVNRGNQTGTITTAAGLTLRGTAAVPAGKNAILDFFRTGAAAWDVAITLSA